MDKKTTIRELNKEETKKLLKSRKFNRFAPVNCQSCGNKGPFKRRLFRIDSDYDLQEEENQDIIRYHMKQNLNLDNIFFRIHKNINYVDTAFCSKCNSNMVSYDIELNDELFDEMSEFLDLPRDKIENDIKKIRALLSNTE
ncbi:MAG: hypothetical protein ACE5R6_20740 [Candidatus Heimdallarchaeota archaeon]